MRVSRVILLICLLYPFWFISAQAQEDAAKNAAAAAVTRYSQLESSGEFDLLYSAMHPDAQVIIPPEAVIGWYENEFAPRGPGDARVFSVLIVPWVWEVTGTMYPNTAVVVYRQPFADGSVVEGTVPLVQDESGNWRWFFGKTREFVDQQIAVYASPATLEDLAPPAVTPAREDLLVVMQEAVATEVSRRTATLEARISVLEATAEAESRRTAALETQVAALEGDLAERDVVTPVPETPAVSPSPPSTPTPVPPPTYTPTVVVLPTYTPTSLPVTATVEPVTPLPVATTEAVPTEAVYLDPRLLISDPEGHIGEFIYVNGTAVGVEQYADFTWVNVVPEVRGQGTLVDQSIVVELRPPAKDLLSYECYRFTGTVGGTREAQVQITGAIILVPYLESSQYEPIPANELLGCQSP